MRDVEGYQDHVNGGGIEGGIMELGQNWGGN